MPEPQQVENDFLAKRQQARNDQIDAIVKSRMTADTTKPQEPAPPDPVKQVEALPSSSFGGTVEGDQVQTTKTPNEMMLRQGAGLLAAKPAEGSITEAMIGPGMLSGVEKEAAATLESVPNIAMIAGSGALGSIPAIARYGGSRLLSAYFGLSMGQALWNKWGEYNQALRDEGTLGPKSREILGRMTVLAAMGIKAGEHAVTDGAPGTTKPAATTAPNGGGTFNMGIDPTEAAKKLKDEPLRVNLKFIDAEQSTKKVIANINQLNADRLAESRKGQSHDVTIAQSKGAMTIQQALALEEGAPLRAGEMVALRDLRDAAAVHVDNLAKATLEGDFDASQHLKSAFALAGELEAKREMASRAVAQSLESHKIPSESARPRLDPKGIATLSDMFSGATDVDPMTLAARLRSLPSTDQKLTYMQQLMGGAKTGQNMVHEAWINALLSGPQTHVANTSSNILTSLYGIPERQLASALHFGDEPGVQRGEAYAMLRGVTEGWSDGLRLMNQAWKTGQDPTGMSKMDVQEPAITSANAGVGADTTIGKAIDLAGTFIRSPSRALTAEDALFKGINYRMELKAQALREGMAEKLEGDALAKRVADIEANPPATVKVAAEKFALLQTFQNELGPAGKAFNDFVKQLPGGRVLLPFIRTPANIMKYAGQRTPILAQLSQKNWADINAGGAAKDLALARMTSGALTAAAIASLAVAGHVTGGGPKDPNLKRELLDTGWQPYSVKIGDTHYSYQRMDPFGLSIGVIADATEIIGQLPEWQANELGTAIAISMSQNMVSKTYMQGIANLVDSISDPRSGSKNFSKGMARSVVPTAVRSVERITDPTLRETNGMLDEIKAGIPGWSDSLPPRRNLYGDPILLSGGLGPDIVSPIYTSSMKHDPVSDEIVRVGVSLTMPSKVIMGTPPPGVRMGPESQREGIELTPKEYDFLVRMAGNELKGPDGRGMKDTLAETFQTDAYKRQSEGPDGGKAMVIRSVVQAFRDAAKSELLVKSPKLQLLMQQKLMDRAKVLQPSDAGQIAIAP